MVEVVRAAATVPRDWAVEFATRAYIAAGVPEDAARKAGVAIVDADLHGTVTHGLKNLRNYVSGLLDKRINPRPNIQEVGGPAAAKIIDADNAHGHVAGHVGMERAIALAREFGVGNVFVRHSNHYGASGYWARLALQHNMIGFAFTTATASIAPWGAREALVGNNPPAWVVPTHVVDESAELQPADMDSMFLDIALSVVAGNRLDIYRRRHEPLPSTNWALDKSGEPTTDPAARQNGGSYAPLTEYKGSGMAIVLAAINNFLSGNVYDDQRTRPEGGQVHGSTSHWFTAYDVAQFVDPAQFTTQVRELRDRIHATTPRAGFERVYAPGEIENEKVRNYTKGGIPLEQFTVDELHWVAEHTGIPWDLPGKS
ncbi:MAG: Ldh family oxidoreductase [Chloroflexi bacterium]|nr:Ldh family oxidoreductase [Chloroflexota bacterium]MBV9545744.1 Ldh family oxidoreductase [Chloroflexota bacterium]